MKIFYPVLFIIISLCGCEQYSTKEKLPKAEKGVLDLRNWDLNEENSSVELRGEWEFYWEQFLNHHDFDNNSVTETSHYFSLPGTWNEYKIDDKKLGSYGFATYRLRILTNGTYDRILFNIPTIQSSSEIYINGKLISSTGITGKSKETSQSAYKPKTIIYIPDSDIVEIIIHVSNFDLLKGGIWGKILAGSEQKIKTLNRIRRDRVFFSVGAILIIALYYLFFFFIHKRKKETIYFSLLCFVIALRILVTGEIFLLDLFPQISWKILIFLEFSSFYASVPLILCFINRLFKDRISSYFCSGIVILAGLSVLITAITPVSVSSHLIPIFQISTIISGFYAFITLIRYSLKKEKTAIIYLTGFIILMIAGANDILYAADLIKSSYTISDGLLALIISQLIVMTMSFAKSFNEVERQQKQLEKTNNEYLHEINKRANLEEDLHQSYKKNARSKLAIIVGLAKLAEYRDSDTGSHIERIQEFTSLLAKELQKKPDFKDYISDEYIEDIHISSILHDIGKVGIPDAILKKPGKLTVEEFEIMKEHARIGGDSIKAVEIKTGVRSFLTLAKEIAYMHHEKWDGSGYPFGIKGEEIPLSARLTALADVYDALTSKRCYKIAFSHEKAKKIIVESSGTHFDPMVVDLFLAIEDKFDSIRTTLEDEIIGDGE